jgi:LysM domain-containing protein
MNKLIRNSLSPIFVFILSACNLFGPQTTIIGNTPVVKLTVQTQNGSTTFSQAGQVITYNYVVTNTGTSPLAGPVIVLDGTKQVTCPEVNTVGNLNNYLDLNETVTCSSSYTITQADVTTGSLTNVATATVGGVTSNQTGITLTLGSAQPSSVLKLTKTSSSQTYGKAGESIIYTYTITNTGATPLGPSQFTVTDNKLAAPVNCGEGNTTLAPNQSVSCAGTYIITQADVNLANVTNSATASGGGQTSATVSISIANLVPPNTQIPPTTSPPSNLTPGITIQHAVAKGEWLIQIVRCYGATYSEVIAANPQISDPNFILPADFPNGTTVTVPHIGSSGKIYGPPCVVFYTIQNGDTWASIAQAFNADIAVLQKANPVALTTGTQIKVPKNSAGSSIGVGLTAAPPVVTTAAPTSTTVMRITIAPGQTTAAQVGIINPNETIHYVISAAQGQTLSIKLTAPANEVAIGVNGPTGLALKPLDASPTWSTTITTGGDHYINMTSLTGSSSKSYTLEVSLTPASAPVATATNTATNTPTTPAP